MKLKAKHSTTTEKNVTQDSNLPSYKIESEWVSEQRFNVPLDTL